MQRLYLVDSFTNDMFRGNPAGVLPDAADLSNDLRQSIARELNASETAFLEERDDAWSLRWHSPVHEVKFCGHATLAAAHVLLTELGRTPPFVFDTRVGPITVEWENDAYTLVLPRFDPEPTDAPEQALLDEFAGRDPVFFENFENLFVRLKSQRDVEDYKPNLARIERVFPKGVCVTAKGDGEVDFVSRYFAPGAGIPEDPVTGSTHATLAPYWASELGKTDLLARQASQRGGMLGCRVQPEHVRISGKAITVFEASLRSPRAGAIGSTKEREEA